MRSIFENKILTVFAEGRVDSTNAPQFEAEIEEAIKSNDPENVIVDADNLEYISSAGLRVMLRMRKRFEGLKVVNVSSEIYEIFDMTGFTEMITVEKAYRKLSVDGCDVIGQGANGKVYRIDRDTIIKVYFNPDCLEDIQRERDLARKAFVAGIPTAIPYDIVRVGETYGSVFELLNADSLNDIIVREPERLDECVDEYVDLMKKIHATEVKKGDMPDMKETVIHWVEFLKPYLDGAKWEKLNRMVREIPDSNHVIHGDYHTKNVMLQNGEVLLIDMDTLALGNPVFEFASIFNAYLGFSWIDSNVSMSFLGIPHDTAVRIWNKTIRLYFGTEDEEKLAEYENKSAIIGFTRLMRRLIRRAGLETEEGRKTIETYKNEIESRLDKVSTLVF